MDDHTEYIQSPMGQEPQNSDTNDISQSSLDKLFAVWIRQSLSEVGVSFVYDIDNPRFYLEIAKFAKDVISRNSTHSVDEFLVSDDQHVEALNTEVASWLRDAITEEADFSAVTYDFTSIMIVLFKLELRRTMDVDHMSWIQVEEKIYEILINLQEQATAESIASRRLNELEPLIQRLSNSQIEWIDSSIERMSRHIHAFHFDRGVATESDSSSSLPSEPTLRSILMFLIIRKRQSLVQGTLHTPMIHESDIEDESYIPPTAPANPTVTHDAMQPLPIDPHYRLWNPTQKLNHSRVYRSVNLAVSVIAPFVRDYMNETVIDSLGKDFVETLTDRGFQAAYEVSFVDPPHPYKDIVIDDPTSISHHLVFCARPLVGALRFMSDENESRLLCAIESIDSQSIYNLVQKAFIRLQEVLVLDDEICCPDDFAHKERLVELNQRKTCHKILSKTIQDKILKDDRTRILVHGESYCGKSTLVADVIQSIHNIAPIRTLVFYHFTGINFDSRNPKNMIKRFWKKALYATGLTLGVISNYEDEVYSSGLAMLFERLTEYASLRHARYNRFIFVIDGVEEFLGVKEWPVADCLSFLPADLHPTVSVVLSMTPESRFLQVEESKASHKMEIKTDQGYDRILQELSGLLPFQNILDKLKQNKCDPKLITSLRIYYDRHHQSGYPQRVFNALVNPEWSSISSLARQCLGTTLENIDEVVYILESTHRGLERQDVLDIIIPPAEAAPDEQDEFKEIALAFFEGMGLVHYSKFQIITKRVASQAVKPTNIFLLQKTIHPYIRTLSNLIDNGIAADDDVYEFIQFFPASGTDVNDQLQRLFQNKKLVESVFGKFWNRLVDHGRKWMKSHPMLMHLMEEASIRNDSLGVLMTRFLILIGHPVQQSPDGMSMESEECRIYYYEKLLLTTKSLPARNRYATIEEAFQYARQRNDCLSEARYRFEKAACLREIGRIPDAISIIHAAGSFIQSLFGIYHPLYLKANQELAEMLMDQKRFEEANRLIEQELEKFKSLFGRPSLPFIQLLMLQSECLIGQKRCNSSLCSYQDTLPTLDECLRMMSIIWVNPTIKEAICRKRLSYCHYELGSYVNSEDELKKSVSIFQNHGANSDDHASPYHDEIVDCLENLALSYGLQDRKAECREMLDRVIQTRTKNPNAKSSDVLHVLDQYIDLCFSMSDFEEAHKKLIILEGYVYHYQNEPQAWVNYHSKAAMAYLQMGNIRAAKAQYDSACEVMRRVDNPNQPSLHIAQRILKVIGPRLRRLGA
eukprot:TRINITY_DN6308_c0_g1_i6.p1 TRINITY_DN6308_c0_g1~~TRINITY_DN6308_c0_g1_i6.p1  ORF type:complete len:1266 (-),score=201.01 TRINITY_DN6308_c0_g1_i6:142-3939(-)